MKLGVLIITSEFTCDEFHTFTCGHCNNIKKVNHGEKAEDLGGHCSICWSIICPGCVERGSCDPFEEKLRRIERRADVIRSYGI